VLRRRIARAQALLVDLRLPLAEIGYASGFPSQAHFTTMFRKLVGTTPGAPTGRSGESNMALAAVPALCGKFTELLAGKRKTTRAAASLITEAIMHCTKVGVHVRAMMTMILCGAA
jgi:AraC-like DNA-binding protein